MKLYISIAFFWIWFYAGMASAGTFTDYRVDSLSGLQLALHDDTGNPLRSFTRLREHLAAHGQQLEFAMNAGMYEADYSPVGLLVIGGTQVSPLNLKDGAGNFFLKPNGVFLVGERGAQIVDARDYPKVKGRARIATQSGPLLLAKGAIHPKLNPASTSRLIRNGVGLCSGAVVFSIGGPASLHEFAAHFRDDLHCTDALYLDGTVSSLYSRDLRRDDQRADLGPMFFLSSPAH